jgi:hypothetical protein
VGSTKPAKSASDYDHPPRLAHKIRLVSEFQSSFKFSLTADSEVDAELGAGHRRVVKTARAAGPNVRETKDREYEHEIAQRVRRAAWLGAGTRAFSSPDSPIPIRQSSFCGISLHIGIPTFFPRIGDRLS